MESVIEVASRTYDIQSNSNLNDIVIEGTLNGEPFVAQVDRVPRTPWPFKYRMPGLASIAWSCLTARLNSFA
jgi:hypothetical protein